MACGQLERIGEDGGNMKRFLIAAAIIVAACAGTAAPPAATSVPVTAAPTRTPDPTPEIQTGVITFGTALDEDTLKVTKVTSRFKRTYPKISWSASLSEPVGATSIELVLASRSASGAERVIERVDVDVSNPDADLFANSADLATIVGNKAGTYVMRYVRDGKVLAEGTFTLVK